MALKELRVAAVVSVGTWLLVMLTAFWTYCDPLLDAADTAAPFVVDMGMAVSSLANTSTASVVFVTLSTRKDHPQFLSSAASFCEFFDFGTLRKWFVVVPDSDTDLYRSTLPRCRYRNVSIPFDVVAESQIVPDFAEPSPTLARPVRGYLKQMILKLAVATVVPPDAYYLVLDSDVYAHKPFSAEDLFVGHRARIDLEHPKFPNPESWFASSARVLGLDTLRESSLAVCASFHGSGSWPRVFSASRGSRHPVRSLTPSTPFTAITIPAQCKPSIRMNAWTGVVAGVVVYAASGAVSTVTCVGVTLATLGTATIPCATTIAVGVLGMTRAVVSFADAEGITHTTRNTVNTHTAILPICIDDRILSIGFTPVLLHPRPITEFLVPRLSQIFPKSPTWVHALLNWHFEHAVDLWYYRFYRFLFKAKDRAVSWTEFSLYYWATVALGEFDTLYAVADASSVETGILDYERSIMDFSDYDNANWKFIFAPHKIDTTDGKRPFLLVHSWMDIPLSEINAHIAPFIPELQALLDDYKGK
ncbi:hypothetical protein HDU83_004304 [Entophlyctis luteolus]|nr:hypothetical protein HDU83_004304 [Entophlyctis luteolus]